MERCADLIGKASTLQEIALVPAGGDERHRTWRAGTAAQTHDELQDPRERTEAKRAEVAKLVAEELTASAQARHASR